MTTPTYARVKLDKLTPHPRNARQGDVGAIVSSLEAHGQYRALVVQKSTGYILAGNHTYRAMLALGWKDAHVNYLDVDDETALRILLVDNRSSDLATYDDDALASLLRELAGTETALVGTGFDGDELDALLFRMARDAEVNARLLATPNDVPAVPATPRTKEGDVWAMGGHTVLCADATDGESVKRLMGGGVADCLWTDPPYGVSYVGKTKDALTIAGDEATGLLKLLEAAFANAAMVLAPGSPWYIAAPSGPRCLDFLDALRNTEPMRLHQMLVWVKNTMVLGHSDYHYRHELVLYGWTAGVGRAGRGMHKGTKWYGDDSQTSVLEFDKPAASELHPTTKPVGLIEKCLLNSTKNGDVVLDLFGGSGSTMIACEQIGRVARVMELDPRYVDVIVTRWEQATGEKAKRERRRK